MDSSQVIAWSAAVSAASFVVLCAFVIRALNKLGRSLQTAREAVHEMKATVEELQAEANRLATSVNEVAADVRDKLEAADPLFEAVRDVGEILSEATETAKIASTRWLRSVRRRAAAADSTGTRSATEGAARSANEGEARGADQDQAHGADWLRWVAAGARIAYGLRQGWATTAYSRAKE